MKKVLFSLLMVILLVPSLSFADYYEYDKMKSLPNFPVKGPVTYQIAFDLDYYSGDMEITPNYDISGLNITIEREGVAYINATVSLTSGQSYTNSLAGYEEGTYILTLSNSDGVIDQYEITVIQTAP